MMRWDKSQQRHAPGHDKTVVEDCFVNVCDRRYACMQYVSYYCRSFRSRRSLIERCFGTLKMSYGAVGTRRFRSRRWFGPVVCNLTAALYNRHRMIFQKYRNALGLT